MGLAGVRTWALYYGSARPEALAQYDLVVVDPAGWDRRSLYALRSKGIRVLAYLPVLEILVEVGEGPPDHVLRVNGAPALQREWGTWILDPRRPATGEGVRLQAERLTASGYDGFFLDTVGDVEDGRWPADLRSLLIPAAAHLVAGLRRSFPRQLMVQNWGFGPLLDLTLPYLDGLCWEACPIELLLPWQHRLAERLRGVAARGTPIFALSSGRAEPPAWVERMGFLWYGAPGAYIQFLPTQHAGR